MKFETWWAKQGLDEYRARCSGFGVYPTAETEAVAKHCAWQAWIMSAAQQAAEMAKDIAA